MASAVSSTSVLLPLRQTYCDQAARVPLHTAKLKTKKVRKYASAYKEQDNTHFEPFALESKGEFDKRATEVFKKLCNIITQQTRQSASNISYFWKTKLLVLLAKVTHNNAIKWALINEIN